MIILTKFDIIFYHYRYYHHHRNKQVHNHQHNRQIITINIIGVTTNTTIIIANNNFWSLRLRTALPDPEQIVSKKQIIEQVEHITEKINRLLCNYNSTGNELHPKLGNYPASHLSVHHRQLSHHDQQHHPLP